MRCIGCGESVESFHRHCPQCGTALAQPARLRRPATQEGIPITHFVPAPYGPPIMPDMPPPVRLSATDGRVQRTSHTARIAPARMARPWRLTIVLVTSLGMALAIWRLGGPPPNPLATITAPSVTVATPTCPTPPVDVAAAHVLTSTQLATTLRDAAHGDYRPANQTTRFATGQPAYLTFKITTSARGTAQVLFCLPGAHVTGTLMIPNGSANRYGQFTATFTPREGGSGEAILWWNGRVAATLPFTIIRAGR